MNGLALTPPSVTCIGAHADDIEIGAGGLVARLAEELPGADFTFIVLSGHDARRTEAESSAVALVGDGVELVWGGFRDGRLPYDAPTEVKDLLAAHGAAAGSLVLAPNLGDAHQDHRFVAELAWQVYRGCTILEYEIPKWETESFVPNLFVPLTSVEADRKVAHLMSHFESQRNKRWYRPETFRAHMTMRGIQCSAESGMAEAFIGRKLVVS